MSDSQVNQKNLQEDDFDNAILEDNIIVKGSDLTKPPTVPVNFRVIKENNAIVIAKMVIRIFAGGLVGSFFVIFLLLGLAVVYPNIVIEQISPVVNNFLEIIRVIGAIFSPLLAFILGYYFSLSAKSDDK